MAENPVITRTLREVNCMKTKLSKKFSTSINHPYLNLFVAAILLYAGLSETLVEIQELEEVAIGGHHGIMLYAFVQILTAFVEIGEGLRMVEEAGK